MEGRHLKRLEALLRRALDTASVPSERQVALEEALRMVTAAQQCDTPPAAWEPFRPMRYLDCALCPSPIKPTEPAWRALVGARELYRHNDCHESLRI